MGNAAGRPLLPAPRSFCRVRSGHFWLSGCAGDEGGHDVGGVPVERHAGAVVAHGGARVGVTCGFLDVAEWDACVEGGGDERVTERVWTDALVDPGPAGDASHDSGGAVSVESCAGAVAEDRSFGSFADGEIDSAGGSWCEWDGHGLAAFAVDDEGAVSSFESELFDVRSDRFRDT